MSRPGYERERDLANERRIAKTLAERYGVMVTKLSAANYKLDWVVWDVQTKFPGMVGHLRAFAELKCRNTTRNQYKYYMLSLAKWERLLDMSEKHDKPSLLYVEFTDGLYYLPVTNGYVLAMGERKPNRDEYDLEPMAFVLSSGFLPVEKAAIHGSRETTSA